MAFSYANLRISSESFLSHISSENKVERGSEKRELPYTSCWLSALNQSMTPFDCSVSLSGDTWPMLDTVVVFP